MRWPTPREAPPRLRRAALVCALLATLAAACAKPASEGVPEEAVRQNILGAAYMGQTKWADAAAAFRAALELRPDDPLLLTNAAMAVNQLGQVDEAVALLERAVADAGYAPGHFNLGLIESRRGNFELAAKQFFEVVRLDPEDLHTRYYLGTSLARIDRPDEAAIELRAALARDPTHVSTLYALGRLLLQRGDQDEGMELVTRSQEIRARSGLDDAVGGEYGEQGRYSRAGDYPGNVLPAPPAIPLRFELTGRVTLAAGPAGIPWTVTQLEGAPGVALLVAQRGSVLQLVPTGRSAALVQTPVPGARVAAIAAGDADNDGRLDLAVLLAFDGGDLQPALFLQHEGAAFGPSAAAFGGGGARLAQGLAGAHIVFVDRDHDGDLDLFWCWSGDDGSGCAIGTNDGDGAFEVRGSADHGFEPRAAAGALTVAFSDVDNDRDVDLLIAGAAGVQLFTNQRDGSFQEVTDAVGLGNATGPVASLSVADLDKDGFMDLLVGTDSGMRLLRNAGGRFADPAPLASGGADEAAAGLVADFDNDGFLDVAATSTTGPFVVRNRGLGEWAMDRELLSGLDTRPIAALDADGDGDLDLVGIDAAGVASLLTNDGGNAHRWIRIAPVGVNDNRFGIGAKVEVLAGSLRQKFEVVAPLPVHAGLGERRRVDAVRYLWPSGVLQDEVGLESGDVTVTQLDRKGTSCPLLYAWRDGGWRFVTDFLGGAAIGYQQAPGVFGTPDTDEYVKIPGGLDRDDAGRLRLRLNNQLEEVIWFDNVELVVVDHPEKAQVYPSERLMPQPPYPTFELFASTDVRPVAAARGVEDGADLTGRLRDLDRRYVDNFAQLRPKGYAELHTLELDLGEFDARRRVVLLLDGWIDYADSSANVAAHQAGLELVPPRLYVADGHGGWIETERSMGFPAGLPKTMTVDLGGRFTGPDHRVRIATSMRIYWDRARVLVGGETTTLSVTRLQPVEARLEFGGFPRPTSPDGRKPFAYDPTDVDPTHSWKAHVGAYTPFGDVRALLAEIDDRFVTTRNGDQIELVFEAPPGPPPGVARTFLLFADGFGKDMDPNSAASAKIGPLPFHGMPTYPYGADVVPPTLPEPAAAGRGRRVAPSAQGWPGAVPLASRLERGS